MLVIRDSERESEGSLPLWFTRVKETLLRVRDRSQLRSDPPRSGSRAAFVISMLFGGRRLQCHCSATIKLAPPPWTPYHDLGHERLSSDRIAMIREHMYFGYLMGLMSRFQINTFLQSKIEFAFAQFCHGSVSKKIYLHVNSRMSRETRFMSTIGHIP